MTKKEAKQTARTKKEISNNLLVLILIVIIFVSILGTITITETIKKYSGEGATTQKHLVKEHPSNAGMVALRILPPENNKGET